MKLFISSLMLFALSFTNIAAHADPKSKAAEIIVQMLTIKNLQPSIQIDVEYDNSRPAGEHGDLHLVIVKVNNRLTKSYTLTTDGGGDIYKIERIDEQAVVNDLKASIEEYHSLSGK